MLIGERPASIDEAAISVVSLTELHFGVLVASDEASRARRLARLASVESHFDPHPVDVLVARECGRLYAAVVQRGGQPRRRAFDLVIAATANVLEVPLYTGDADDLRLVADLVDLRVA